MQRLTTVGRTPLEIPQPDNTQHSQQTDMPLVEFEPTISAGKRPQTYALDPEGSRRLRLPDFKTIGT